MTLASRAREAYLAQERQRSIREKLAENSARQAFFSTEHTVSGVGYVSVKAPVMFDVTFVTRPSFSFAPLATQLPDVKHYRYPMVNAGVYKWVTTPTPEAKAAKAKQVAAMEKKLGSKALHGLDNSAIYTPDELMYEGAYLYFNVAIESIHRPRSDGSNLSSLEALRDITTDVPTLAQIDALIAESKEAVYLAAHPPKATFVVSVTWMGVATKTIPSDVLDLLHNDPSIQPVVPPVIAPDAQ